MQSYSQDETIKDIDFTGDNKTAREYDSCNFINCNFSKTDLSNVIFTECLFENCNLSSVKITNTSFQQVVFKSCKMLGLQFDECNGFGLSVSFVNCVLNHSSFYQANISETTFTGCQLKQVDFSHADLTQSVFDECDLSSAAFHQTNHSKSNLRTAVNFSIDPTKNKIQKAKFELNNIRGLLDCFGIEIES